LAHIVAHAEQVVSFGERANRASLLTSRRRLCPLNELSTPTVRRGVRERTEQFAVDRGLKLAGLQRQVRLGSYAPSRAM
jgi:hypothetical protein